MDKINLNLPTMYGDHHITEVRRILLAIPGIDAVYASGSLRIAQVRFDPAVTSEDAIRSTLEAAGYAESLSMPAETGIAAVEEDPMSRFFRHTAAYAQVNSTVSFSQRVNYSGRPLWPCPGMGPIKIIQQLEDDVGDG